MEKIISQDRQMNVDGYRHRNFSIWSIFAKDTAVLVKYFYKIKKVLQINKLLQIYLFFTKTAVSQANMDQIEKFLWL